MRFKEWIIQCANDDRMLFLDLEEVATNDGNEAGWLKLMMDLDHMWQKLYAASEGVVVRFTDGLSTGYVGHRFQSEAAPNLFYVEYEGTDDTARVAGGAREARSADRE
jgi:hypothetical protein